MGHWLLHPARRCAATASSIVRGPGVRLCSPLTRRDSSLTAMAKRKRSTTAAVAIPEETPLPIPTGASSNGRRRAAKTKTQPAPADVEANPDLNPRILDGLDARRASPDSDSPPAEPRTNTKRPRKTNATPPSKTTSAKKGAAVKVEVVAEPEADEEADLDEAEDVQAAASRPPAVNSDYLPLPWKGRLGYVRDCPGRMMPLTSRLASAPICALPTHPSSARVRAASRRSWSSATRSRTRRSHTTRQRTGQTRTSRPTSPVARRTSRASAWPTRATLSRCCAGTSGTASASSASAARCFPSRATKSTGISWRHSPQTFWPTRAAWLRSWATD